MSVMHAVQGNSTLLRPSSADTQDRLKLGKWPCLRSRPTPPDAHMMAGRVLRPMLSAQSRRQEKQMSTRHAIDAYGHGKQHAVAPKFLQHTVPPHLRQTVLPSIAPLVTRHMYERTRHPPGTTTKLPKRSGISVLTSERLQHSQGYV